MNRTQYDEIVRYLKADDQSSFQHKLKRKVKTNNYFFFVFPSLGKSGILFVPVWGAEKVNVFNHFIIIFLIHSAVEKEFKRYQI